ncbi:helix-turn-helix domain-containing protein [Leuconostoc mesenteroides]|uniref:helix-turn-helix domain-containing protein n=1 Tax=Leuconostoc mesenteroides TaxID=1245 RepID=UPI0021C05D3D|nr:helix-turn-helix domain-containing protein [Leuconostoc mesenteroides]
MGYTKWTDEYKNRVAELGKQGLSSSKIAQKLFDEFGVNLSRRTVSRYLALILKKWTIFIQSVK